jgi:hypothetical protein
MQVGNKVYLFRNTNLSKYNSLLKRFEYKDPSKGIVHSKREGVIHLILLDGESITGDAMTFYSQGNNLVRRSFENGSAAAGVRIIIKYTKGTYTKYGILREPWWTKANHKSPMGYAIVHSNAIDFITSDK